MPAFLASFLRKPFWRRRTFWYGSFCGRVTLFVLACAAGSILPDSLVAISEMHGISSWWEYPGIGFLINTAWMTVFGFIIGGVVCTGVALAALRWNVTRKSRFSLYFARHLLLPVFVGLPIMPLLAAAYWLLSHGKTIFNVYSLDSMLLGAEFIAFPVLSILFGVSSVYRSRKRSRSKTRRRGNPSLERLLPLD